jgi:nucleoside-diphosphate-sugar epimerase
VRILFTGASSFTGFWFARELAREGHEVVATFRRAPADYEGVRRARVDGLAAHVRAVAGCAFGDDRFLALVADEGPWDLLCHHAADATDYKSPEFDALGAAARNTHRIAAVLSSFRGAGGRALLLTGSVFEGGEGAGSEGLPHFSPYGLSKALTAQVVAYEAGRAGLGFGKFVIANPFGPFEEPRFTHYLVRSWQEGRTAAVESPAYVRDNIHVSLLARAYAVFAGRLARCAGPLRLLPSGYVESVGRFAERFAREMGPRLGIDCPLELRAQTEFREPRVRINTDPLDAERLGWSEAQAWDELAAYYGAAPAARPAG